MQVFRVMNSEDVFDDDEEKPCFMAKYSRHPSGMTKMEIYSCYQVRAFQELWKSDFKKEEKGLNYNEFCENIDDFLSKCRCLEE